MFLITGFFLNEAVVCPLGVHATAVAGGGMTPERIEQAEAPWLTWLPDTDQPETVTRALAEAGELDGTVGVYAAERDQETMEDHRPARARGARHRGRRDRDHGCPRRRPARGAELGPDDRRALRLLRRATR